MVTVNLNENELKVLRFLAKQDEDFGCYPFSPLAKSVRLNRAQVRLACPSLKRKGLTEFHTGLWDEWGERMAGSGYCASREGRELMREAK